MAADLDEIRALLSGVQTRRAFLESLLKNLSDNEARSMFTVLSERFAHFDLVAHLPIEILALVFDYLPLTACFRLQRVSKAWKSQLSSLSLQSACLAPHFPSQHPPLAGEPTLPAEKIFALRAKHVLAVQSQLPYSWSLNVVITRFSLQNSHLGYNCDYYNNIFVWIPAAIPGVSMPEGECVKTFNLCDASQRLYRAIDRGKILCVRVLAGHLVLITRTGTAYAWWHGDENAMDLPLLNANVECIGGRDRYFAISWVEAGVKRTFWVWDLYLDRVQSVETADHKHDVKYLCVSTQGDYLEVTRQEQTGERKYDTQRFHIESGEQTFYTQSQMPPRRSSIESRNSMPEDIAQPDPQGLSRVFEEFVDTVPEFRSIRSDADRFQSITQRLDRVGIESISRFSIGDKRLRISIVDLHPQNPFPYGQNRAYLFCVSSFDQHVKLSGGDKSLVMNETPTHLYA